MINVSRVLRSKYFKQSFDVYRSSGHFGKGGWIEEVQSPPYFSMSGAVYPSSAKEIQQVPEGDRTIGMMTFLSEEPLYVTRKTGDTTGGLSDQIEWKGDKYKIIQCLPYVDYGYYAVVGTRLAGD